MKSGLAQQECGKDSDCWNERCEHALPIWAKLQALIYGAPPFVRAGYASVREKLDDITRRDREFMTRATSVGMRSGDPLRSHAERARQSATPSLAAPTSQSFKRVVCLRVLRKAGIAEGLGMATGKFHH